MNDAFDVVIIGGGHNGLVAALRLAQARLSVCVLEARDRFGGCAITTEPLLPGLRHSPHANTLFYTDLMPRGIRPTDLKVRLAYPAAQFGVAFADGRPPVILHRPDLLDETVRSLSVYSAADASTYAVLKRRSARLGPVLRRGLYAPPAREWFKDQRRAVSSVLGPLAPGTLLGQGIARHLIDKLFAAPEVRTLMYALAMETGVDLQEIGGDLAFLGFSLWVAGRWRLPLAGMQAYSDALVDAAGRAGVQCRPATTVEQILVQDERAIGIRTRDGEIVSAKRAVVAAIPVLNLYDHLLAPPHIARSEQSEIAVFRQGAASSIGTLAFGLNSAPGYASARHDPDIDRCLKTVIGFDTPADVLRHAADVRSGLLPRPAGVVRVHSLWDETAAPAGKHIAAVDSALPAIGSMDAATWAMVRSAYPQAFLNVWTSYRLESDAPSSVCMTLDDELDVERRMLLRLGPGQYRTSIEGLYLAGPGVHPGGGVHGACGYNAADVLRGTSP